MSNVLSEEKRQQVIALGRLGWPLRRIEQETGVRRETAGAYLKAAGIGVRPPRGWGRRPPAKPANEVTPGSDVAKTAMSVISDPNRNPETPSNKEQAKAEISKPANGVTTGFGVDLRGSGAGNLKPVVCASACEPFREAIELGLRQGRNATAIWRDLVSESGFGGGYQSVKRFVSQAARKPGTAATGGDSHRARRRGSSRLRHRPDGARSADKQISTHPIVRDDAGVQPQGGTLSDLPLQLTDLGRAARASLPSTGWLYPHRGYREYQGMYERYIRGRDEAQLRLWEYDTPRVQQLLQGIVDDHDLSKTSMQHIKHFLSGAFRAAALGGLREGNPVTLTKIPRTARPAKKPPAYPLATTRRVLSKLRGDHEAVAVVSVAAYAGLRMSEIAGLHWDDYADGQLTNGIRELTVRRTRVRNVEGPPKSDASGASIPVVPALAKTLAAWHRHQSPSSERMFTCDSGGARTTPGGEGVSECGRPVERLPLLPAWLGKHPIRARRGRSHSAEGSPSQRSRGHERKLHPSARRTGKISHGATDAGIVETSSKQGASSHQVSAKH